MKVFINNFNLLTWPRAMAEKLAREGHEVIFVDNASTYGPLLAFYDSCPYRVLRLRKNVGHTAPWQYFKQEMSEDFYVVTDPDLDISGVPSDWPTVLTAGMAYFDTMKCGLSLDDTCIPSENPAWKDDRFCDYPDGGAPHSWGPPLETDIDVLPWPYYNRPTDTTFAVYAPGSPYFIGGIRAGRPFTARHLPWHIVPRTTTPTPLVGKVQIQMDDELEQYFRTANNSSTTAWRMRNAGIIS